MIWFGGKINKNYGWDFSALHKYRDFSDGISFFEFDVTWDRFLSDHKPSFQFIISILNFKLIELEIYYVFHRDRTELDRAKDTVV